VVGWLFERAGSDLFAFVQDQLTVEKKDFDAPAIAVDAGVALTPRADVLFGFEFGGATTKSEYRDYVDNNRLPITQATRLRQVNLSTSLRMALTPRGQEVSRLAWIPNAVTPYVGAGPAHCGTNSIKPAISWISWIFQCSKRRSVPAAGSVAVRGGWLFERAGSDLFAFVQDQLTVETPSAHLFGGVDVKVSRRLFVTGEGRYLWSHAELDRDFSGFEPIDLTGFKLTAGVSYIF